MPRPSLGRTGACAPPPSSRREHTNRGRRSGPRAGARAQGVRDGGGALRTHLGELHLRADEQTSSSTTRLLLSRASSVTPITEASTHLRARGREIIVLMHPPPPVQSRGGCEVARGVARAQCTIRLRGGASKDGLTRAGMGPRRAWSVWGKLGGSLEGRLTEGPSRAQLERARNADLFVGRPALSRGLRGASGFLSSAEPRRPRTPATTRSLRHSGSTIYATYCP